MRLCLYIKLKTKFLDTKAKSPLGNIISKSTPEKPEEVVNEEEKQKQREQSWKTMKITLAVFGASFTCLGAYLIYTLGKPEIDPEGYPIKDDLSDKPIIIQYIIRTYRELDYYRRVRIGQV